MNELEAEDYIPSEEEEMVQAIEQNRCFLSDKPLFESDHLLLVFDETFQTVEHGSLKPLIKEI